MRTLKALSASVTLALAACSGDGEGLDANGRPEGEVDTTLRPTFESIQTNVFTPICTRCHAGAAAPAGLSLEAGVSYAMLVSAPSRQVPALRRVQPGNPDASYLVQKIEGRAAVGQRMPLGGPPLAADTIAVIRQWILDGAQRPVAPAAVGKAAQFAAVTPQANVSTTEAPTIVIQSDQAIDTSLLDAGVISLRASGQDGRFDDGNERELKVRTVIRSHSPLVLELTSTSDWDPDHYELRVSGTAPLALADLDSTVIDGDADGVSGGDFVVRFEVEAAQ